MTIEQLSRLKVIMMGSTRKEQKKLNGEEAVIILRRTHISFLRNLAGGQRCNDPESVVVVDARSEWKVPSTCYHLTLRPPVPESKSNGQDRKTKNSEKFPFYFTEIAEA